MAVFIRDKMIDIHEEKTKAANKRNVVVLKECNSKTKMQGRWKQK